MTWNRLPEWTRWLLFLPALLLGCMGFGLLLQLLNALRGDSGFWVADLGVAGFVAWAFFPMVFALAPRRKAVVGWVFYVMVMGFVGVSLVLMIVRGLGIAGLLSALPPPEWATWTRSDWIDLGRGVAWAVVGTFSFRQCVEKHRSVAEKPGAVGDAVLDCRREFKTIKAGLLDPPTPQYLGLPDEVFVAVERLIDNTEATTHTVRVDKVPPRLLVWVVFSNVTGDALATGGFHNYRNVLSFSGKALLTLFMRSIDELEKGGHYEGRDRTAEQERSWIRRRIAEAG